MAHALSSRSSARLSDEELEYYGDLYVRYAIREGGVDFEAFLGNPEHYLDEHTARRWRIRGNREDGRRKGLASYLRLRSGSRDRAQ